MVSVDESTGRVDCEERCTSLPISWSLALKCVANRTKTPTWKHRKDGDCSKRTFQGRHHVSGHTKGYAGDSGGVVVTCEDRPCASNERLPKIGEWSCLEINDIHYLHIYSFNIKGCFWYHVRKLTKTSVLTWEMNFLWDWFSILVWQKNEFQSRTAMDHIVNIINVASTQIKRSSLDGPSCGGRFTLKNHEKSLIGLPVRVH